MNDGRCHNYSVGHAECGLVRLPVRCLKQQQKRKKKKPTVALSQGALWSRSSSAS